MKPKPKLTEAEEVLGLLKETKESVDLDDRYNTSTANGDDQTTDAKISDMEKRLNNLKGVKESKFQYVWDTILKLKLGLNISTKKLEWWCQLTWYHNY